MAGPKLEHLRLMDLSDREVLLVMLDVADGDGWVDGPDVARQLAMTGDHPQRMVASRLAWLRRYGAVERELLWDDHGNPVVTRAGQQRHGQRWRLTDIGLAIARGKLRAAQEKALGALDDEQLLLVTRFVADRARGSVDRTAAKLAEREWKHQWTRTNGYPPGY